MAQSSKLKTILAKIEGTYGVDAAPTPAADAVVTRGFKITPLDGDTVSRNLDRPTFGNDQEIMTSKRVKVEFEVEAQASGTSGPTILPPAYAPLLRACGLKQTVILTAGQERVEFKPVSSGHESVTLFYHQDRNFHKLLGARGTVSFDAKAKDFPVFKFSLEGLYVPVVDAAPPVSPDFTKFKAPLAVATGTTTFTLHGFAAVLESLNVDLKNTVSHRVVVGDEQIRISDRKPSAKVVMDSPSLTGINYFNRAADSQTGALAFQHGTVAGYIVKVDAPVTAAVKPNYGDADGVATLEMDVSIIPNLGDDEIVFTFK